jgi:plastocyanin
MTTRMKGGVAALVLLAGALLFAACGGGGSSPTSGAASAHVVQTNHITISNFMFSPMAATVAPGARVNVTNKDSVTHTLTATGGQFNTGAIAGGQTKSFMAPTAPGTYHYICNIHQYMMGTITVS